MDTPCNFLGKCAYNEVCCCENGIKECDKMVVVMCDGEKWGIKTSGMRFCAVPCKVTNSFQLKQYIHARSVNNQVWVKLFLSSSAQA